MNLLFAAFAFIFDPANLLGERGILPRLVDHLLYTGLGLAVAFVIGIPLGLLIGHTGKGRNFVIAVTSSFRAIPTFGLLLFIILFTGLGLWPLVVVLAILAVPPLLAGAYSGLESVNRDTVDAARAIGMTEWQILFSVEIPLALPLILGGVRSATLQVIATATIAGYVGLTGLGRFLIEGLALHNYTIALAGAILVAALALAADGLLALVQKLVVPRGVSRGLTRSRSIRPKKPTGFRVMAMAPTKEG
ncbi:MAG: ABC transporter permease [Cryobacterium sp.]|nr:ABC transporter permease [Cryobacterium sp.]